VVQSKPSSLLDQSRACFVAKGKTTSVVCGSGTQYCFSSETSSLCFSLSRAFTLVFKERLSRYNHLALLTSNEPAADDRPKQRSRRHHCFEMRIGDEHIRRSWDLDLIAACQRLVGHTLSGRQDDFAAGLRVFSAGLQAPTSVFERQLLRDCVIGTLLRAGQECHDAFHRRSGLQACAGSPFERAWRAWNTCQGDVADAIREWTTCFITDFDRHHQWPAHWRAAERLETHFAEPFDVCELAAGVGCGRSTLMRRFSEAFGLSVRAYHTQMRVRHAIILLRSPDSYVDAVARQAGYGSTKNFYRALRTTTSLTPSQIRDLSADEFDRLLHLVPVLSSAAGVAPAGTTGVEARRAGGSAALDLQAAG
jgi:AraC-like DNA-binding protein